MTDQALWEEAKKAREKSYAPYSGFKVGAALLTADGNVYHGCNIENAAYTPSNCAERTAFFRAIYEGQRNFIKIAVAGGKEGEDATQPCAPCGVCRQVMMEFCEAEQFFVILSDGRGGCKSISLAELFPFGFGPENLGQGAVK